MKLKLQREFSSSKKHKKNEISLLHNVDLRVYLLRYGNETGKYIEEIQKQALSIISKPFTL